GGSLYFQGKYYPLSTGGVDYGLVFGGFQNPLDRGGGNIWQPFGVAGGFCAGGGGGGVGGGGPSDGGFQPQGGGAAQHHRAGGGCCGCDGDRWGCARICI